jgi:hypothetical protein
VQPEPVSPELVLVDPELAQRERARLTEHARLAAMLDLEALRRAVEHDLGQPEETPSVRVRRDVGGFARRKLLPAALMCSLLVNGFLAAELLVRTDSSETAVAVPAAARPVSVGPDSRTQSTGVATPPVRVPTEPLPQKALVEQKLVSMIVQAPTRKLPRAFVDPATGLVKNNVRVICRSARARSYLCTVRLPGATARGGLVVRYRHPLAGKAVFTWYGYRRNAEITRFLQDRRKTGSKRDK